PTEPPLREIVQLLSHVFLGVCGCRSQSRQGKGGLGQYQQADLCLGPLESATMQATEIAMLLRVPETAFDQGTALSSYPLGLRRTHPRLVCLYQLFAFQPLYRSTLFGIADTAVAKRTCPAVLRRAVELVLKHRVFVSPSFLLSPPVFQSVPHWARVRLLFGEPLELVLAYARVRRLCSPVLGEVVFLHWCDQDDTAFLTFLQV